MSQKELVSIIMPNYNCEKFVYETVKSVIDQTYENWELLFVDDCSTDKSVEIVESFNDSRIRILKNPKNSGAAISRNYALREAKGKWIAFLDSDDLWHREKLERQIKFMKDNGYAFSYTFYDEIGEDGTPFNKEVKGPKRIGKRKIFRYCWMGCLTVMYDREVVGLIQIEDLKKNNDYAMWLKVCKKADCYAMEQVLSSYRVRGGSISRQSKFKLIKHHYILFRKGEKKNALSATWFTFWNLFWGVYKKLKYVKTRKDK